MLKSSIAFIIGLCPLTAIADTLNFTNTRYGLGLNLPYSVDGMALNWSRLGWDWDADGAWFKLVGPDVEVLTFGRYHNAESWANSIRDTRSLLQGDGYTIEVEQLGENEVTLLGSFDEDRLFAWRSVLAHDCDGNDIVVSVRIEYARSEGWFGEYIPAVLESLRGCGLGD